VIKSCQCESESSLSDIHYYFDRPHFFPRQMVGPEDLNDLLDYSRQKSRLRNRMLFGWGVVCGAIVDGEKNAAQVSVSPGFILGPYGDEIYIPSVVKLDLSECGVTVDPECPAQQRSPYHVASKGEPRTVFIAVRYDERKTQWKKAEPAGCGCDSSSCEYTRVRDWFEIRCLTYCPNPCLAEIVNLDRDEEDEPCLFENRECEPCPDEPWVVLAAVELNEEGLIKRVRNCVFNDTDPSCRRRVVNTAGNCWCSGPVELDEQPERKDEMKAYNQ